MRFKKYRVVEDEYLGFEIQVKYIFFPIVWFQWDFSNTYPSLEAAKSKIALLQKSDIVLFETFFRSSK